MRERGGEEEDGEGGVGWQKENTFDISPETSIMKSYKRLEIEYFLCISRALSVPRRPES